VRAQLLSMRSFRLGSSRRGALLSIVTGLIWYGIWSLVAIAALIVWVVTVVQRIRRP